MVYRLSTWSPLLILFLLFFHTCKSLQVMQRLRLILCTVLFKKIWLSFSHLKPYFVTVATGTEINAVFFMLISSILLFVFFINI